MMLETDLNEADCALLSSEEIHQTVQSPNFWIIYSHDQRYYAYPLSMAYSREDNKFYAHTVGPTNAEFYQHVRMSPNVIMFLQGWSRLPEFASSIGETMDECVSSTDDPIDQWGRSGREVYDSLPQFARVIVECRARMQEVKTVRRKQAILALIGEHYFPQSTPKDIQDYYQSVADDLVVWEMVIESMFGYGYRKDAYFEQVTTSPRPLPAFRLHPTRAL